MENELIEIRIPEGQANERLDKVVPQLFVQISRSQVQKLIDHEQLWVNGEATKAAYKVKVNDIITLQMEQDDFTEIQGENIPLDIRYEDADVIVVNKAQGMVVHPAAGHNHGTLVNALVFHFQHLSLVNGPLRPGIVHRIDKDTSGLLMVAKHDQAHQVLAHQIKEKTAHRIYWALVHGVVPAQEGTIKAPIGRHPVQRKEMGVVYGGKEATTHFKVLERFTDVTLLECRLETGRTHQIRVHLDHIGYPIMGDPVYSSKRVPGLQGQLLHAKKLVFKSPSTEQIIEVEAPLPESFKRMLETLQNHGSWEERV